MRKIKATVLLLIVVVSFTGCSIGSNYHTKDYHIPNSYVSSEDHWQEGGFRDYTDFCIYQYDSVSKIEAIPGYHKVEAKDIEEISGYFSNFRQWMETENRLDEYSFDENCISVGDYFLLVTKEGEPIGNGISAYEKYDCYTLYFFDVETLTLYYIHNNS